MFSTLHALPSAMVEVAQISVFSDCFVLKHLSKEFMWSVALRSFSAS